MFDFCLGLGGVSDSGSCDLILVSLVVRVGRSDCFWFCVMMFVCLVVA